jgi:1-acyl-sn-glycerol-3-phosphate acyltransferase
MLSHAVFLLVFRGRVLHTERVPKTGGVLLVCNHQSYLDPVLAALALPREAHFMARDTLFRGGFFKPLIESLNAFPVKRGSADIGAIKETLKRLKNGGLITVFPEATRTEDGTIRPMQPGVVLVARKAGVPLVPTLILGAFEAWPRQAKLPRPRRVLVAYGQPVTAERMRDLTDEECVALVRGRFVELMERYRRHPHVAGRLKRLPGRGAGGE